MNALSGGGRECLESLPEDPGRVRQCVFDEMWRVFVSLMWWNAFVKALSVLYILR